MTGVLRKSVCGRAEDEGRHSWVVGFRKKSRERTTAAPHTLAPEATAEKVVSKFLRPTPIFKMDGKRMQLVLAGTSWRLSCLTHWHDRNFVLIPVIYDACYRRSSHLGTTLLHADH